MSIDASQLVNQSQHLVDFGKCVELCLNDGASASTIRAPFLEQPEQRIRMAHLDTHPSGSPPTYSSTDMNSSTPSPCSRCNKAILDQQSITGNDPNQALPGWPNLAKLIADNSGFEAFPIHRDLNIKMLLYYQAEVQRLKRDLREQELEDFKEHAQIPGCDRDVLHQNVEHLLDTKYKSDPDARRQYDLVLEIREILDKYSLYP